MALTNETTIKPTAAPEGYTHYGPENGGATLPSGTDFTDSMNKAGWQSTTGQNPYFTNGATSGGNLSLGGTQEASTPAAPAPTAPAATPIGGSTTAAPAASATAAPAATTPTISELTLGGTGATAPATTATTGGHQYTQQEIDFLKWVNTPEGQAWAAGQNGAGGATTGGTTTGGATGGHVYTQQEKDFLTWLNTDEGKAWAAQQNGGATGGTSTGTPTGGNQSVADFLTWVSSTPAGQSFAKGVAPTTAKTEFTDQGDGVYRGWSSTGQPTTFNTTMPDGSVQGQFRDTRGNEFRADEQGTMSVEDAAAAAAAANNRTVGDKELAGYQLNDLLKQDSPLMQLARQDGITMANARGLTNSSLAAGASMAEMTRQASPLAQQQAEAHRQAGAQNQQLESSRLEQNAGREQQTSLFNAQSQNAATSQEYSQEGQRRLTNAGMANDMLNADRQRSMTYALQQLAGDQDYAKQQLASEKAIDLANVEGQYKMLISENDTAARMFDSTYKSIADIMSNDKIFADEAAEKISYLVQNMQAMMESLLAYENFDFTLPTSTGSGKGSNFGAATP